MTNKAPRGADDYNTKIVEEFRANGGRVGGTWTGTPLILIHHVGAKSGVERVMPLGCFALGEGRFAIVASNGGSSAHPDWYYNLKANPRVNVEVGTETFTVLAEELDGTARAGLWPRLVTDAPSLGEYQARTARQIPVFMLTPVSRSVLGFWPARERARVGRASRAVGRSRRRWRPDRAAQGSRSPCTQLVFGAAAYVASMTTC